MKKRERYRLRARRIADEQGLRFDPDDWPVIWGLIEKHGEPDYLYAIVDRQKELVKFGKSKNPGQRLRAIKTGNPADLELWAHCIHEIPFTEREVHKRLAKLRIDGEWFSLC